jgi:glucosylceramidase
MLVASPWSPPSWLRQWNSLIAYSVANTLIDSDQVYGTYADYFQKVVSSLKERGVEVSYITLQNEPLFGDSSQYPGMYLSSDQAIRLAKLVSDRLPPNTKILSYDHNWDHPEYPLSMLNSIPDKLGGVAWHCYGGDMSTALNSVHDQFPYVDQHITECTSSFPNGVCDINQGMYQFGNDHEWDMQNLFLGAASQNAVSGIKWIMALDENCGPTLPLVTYKNGRPLVSIPSWAQSMDDIKFNQDYWTIAHMSKFIPTGSVRVQSYGTDSAMTKSSGKIGGLLTETFLDQSSSEFSMIVMNTNHWEDAFVTVNEGDHWFSYSVPKFATVVFQWKK